MSKRYLIIPSTRKKVHEGDVISLARLPGQKWVIEFGWYTYYNYQYTGWYLTGIPDGEVIPFNDEDLDEVTIISTNSSADSPVVPPPSPSPVGPSVGPPNQDIARSWISVDTIAQRDRLSRHPLPDGKIVRVNRTTNDGDPKYYVWNVVTESWDDFSFVDGDVDYLTREEVIDLLQEKEIQESLKNTVKEVVEEVVPEYVSETVKDIQDDLKDMKRDIRDLKEDVEDLKDNQDYNNWQDWPEI